MYMTDNSYENWKRRQDIMEFTLAKEVCLNQQRMDLAQQKMRLQAYRKEAEKARYSEVVIGQGGEVEIVIKNPLVVVPQRKVANFRCSPLIRLESSDGDEGYFRLGIEIDGKCRDIILDGGKVGKVSYLLKKINAVGGRIFADKKSEAEQIVKNLWSTLLGECQQTIVIPACTGWIMDEERKFKFIEEDQELWEQIRNKAK